MCSDVGNLNSKENGISLFNPFTWLLDRYPVLSQTLFSLCLRNLRLYLVLQPLPLTITKPVLVTELSASEAQVCEQCSGG